MALAVWAVAFVVLAGATALACDVEAKLTVDNRSPYVAQTVHFDASGSQGYDGNDGKIVAYRFNFGDGTGTDWQSNPKTAHAYAKPGNVTVSVTVKDKRGETDTASLTLTVRPLPAPVPDLAPVFATIDPSHPTDGNAVNLTAVLLNRGNGTATAARVNVYDERPDGTTVPAGTASVREPIAPLATHDVTIGPFPAIGAGTHTLRVVVANVTPIPARTGDHALDLTMSVSPRIPEVPEIVPISAILDPGHPIEGDLVNLTVFLLNRGNATAESAAVAITDHRPDGTATILGSSLSAAPLAPSGVASVAFGPFRATGVGGHILELTVTNVTPKESVPGNPTLNLSMVVAAGPPPPSTDLVPAFAALQPAQPTEGELVNLTAVLVNRGTETVASANLTVLDIRPNGVSVPLGTTRVPAPLVPSGPVTVRFGPFLAYPVGSHILQIVVTDVSPPPLVAGGQALNLTMTVSPYAPSPARYPDLTPIAGTIDPSQPSQRDSVNLTVYVLNRGQTTANGASLMFYDGGPDGTEFLGSVPLPAPLAPLTVEVVAFGPFLAGRPGDHLLQIVLTNVNPPESAVGDNILQVPMTVTSGTSSPGQGRSGTFDVGALVIAVLAGAGIAAAAGTAVYFLRPAPPGPMEPPSPDPPDHSPRPIWPP